jgi:hypothetical protein
VKDAFRFGWEEGRRRKTWSGVEFGEGEGRWRGRCGTLSLDGRNITAQKRYNRGNR